MLTYQYQVAPTVDPCATHLTSLPSLTNTAQHSPHTTGCRPHVCAYLHDWPALTMVWQFSIPHAHPACCQPSQLCKLQLVPITTSYIMGPKLLEGRHAALLCMLLVEAAPQVHGVQLAHCWSEAPGLYHSGVIGHSVGQSRQPKKVQTSAA